MRNTSRETPIRSRLLTLYTRALLEKPPVRGLAEGEPRREELAAHLAAKDVDRLLDAVAESGGELAYQRAPNLFAHPEDDEEVAA